MLILSWIVFLGSTHSTVGLIIGIVLIVFAFQALHITNQTILFSKFPEARNRVNIVYMGGFFMGGASGTSLPSIAWVHFGWKGVSILGLAFSVLTLLFQLIFQKKKKKYI